MFSCNQIIGKNSVDNYYEFLYVLALAAECGRRGDCLDMSKMAIFDTDMLSKDDIEYMHYLRDIGVIYDGIHEKKYDKGSVEEINMTKPKLYFNMDIITRHKDHLFKENETNYYWEADYVYSHYGSDSQEVGNRKTRSSSILHLTAYMQISMMLGEIPQKELHFFIRGLDVRNPYIYITLYACARKLEWLKNNVKIIFDKNQVSALDDLDFMLLYLSAQHSGRLKTYSLSEKMNIFKKLGFKVGDIAILYSRHKISENNPVGKIQKANIIKFNDYSEDLKKNPGWFVTVYTINGTKEEAEEAYYMFDREKRETMFSDMREHKFFHKDKYLSFNNVAFSSYFRDEENIICPIDKEETTHLRVSIDGEIVTKEMSEVDAIYWLLCQNNIDFDKDRYKEYYNNGNALLYDVVDPTFVSIAGNYKDN